MEETYGVSLSMLPKSLWFSQVLPYFPLVDQFQIRLLNQELSQSLTIERIVEYQIILERRKLREFSANFETPNEKIKLPENSEDDKK